MKCFRSFIGFAGCWVMFFGMPAAAFAEPSQAVKSVILVPARAIYPGDVIVRDVVREQVVTAPASSGAGYLVKLEESDEFVARRTLLPGQPIPLAALRKKALIVQGRTYALQYRSEHITIAGSAFALQAGAVGDVINARNADTGIVVKARIAADQTLVVEGP